MAFEEIQSAVAEGKPRQAARLVEEALAEGAEGTAILNQGLLGGMRRVRLKMQDDIDVARALASARAMKEGMEKLKTFLEQGAMNTRERF